MAREHDKHETSSNPELSSHVFKLFLPENELQHAF